MTEQTSQSLAITPIEIKMPNVPELKVIESLKELARIAAAGQLAKTKNPHDAFFIAMYGMELGIPPMTAMRTIYSVNGGAPTCSGEAMLSLLRKSGKVRVKVPNPGEVKDSATVTIERLDTGEKGDFTFTMEMARRAGLVKEKSNWEKYPQMMLIWRAVSMGAKLLCSDIIGGLYTVEEIYPDTPVDETGAPVGDVVEGTIVEEKAPATRQDSKPDERIPDPTPEPWANAERIDFLLAEWGKKNIQASDVKRILRFDDIRNYAKWNTIFTSGKEAFEYVIAKVNEEMANTPPATPKKSQWTAEDLATAETLHMDYDLADNAAALALVQAKTWAEFKNLSVARSKLMTAAIARKIPMIAYGARYIKVVKGDKETTYVEFTTPTAIRLYSREALRNLGDDWFLYVETWEPGQAYEFAEDTMPPLKVAWEKKSNYFQATSVTVYSSAPEPA